MEQRQTFPPPDYAPTPSHVEGIVVYAPAPETKAPKEALLDFKCPRCGATTAYSVADGGIRCEYCGYYEPPEREIVGKGAREFEFKVETLARAAHGWGTERKALSCQNCGAQTSVPPEVMTYTCPFCGSNKVIQQAASQEALRPRFLLPFQVTQEACNRIVREWLGSSWMVPGDLQQLASAADFTAMYLPFWTFDAVARARWKAEVGHTKTERYYQDGEWKTRTKTVWRWESGNVSLTFDDVPRPGTDRLSAVLMEKIKRYDLNALVPYDPTYLAGIHAQAYDVLLEVAWDQARHQMREKTRAACRSQASTSKIRNFSMELDFSDESWRYILVPAYVAAYTYADATYQVMINGQTGAIAGQRPVDWTKVGLAIGGLLAPGLLLTIVGMITALLGVGVPIAIVGFVLLIIGGIIAFILFQKAEGMDDV
jgi:DNA-directed RNA polymerase subunit RPC12/RpoP